MLYYLASISIETFRYGILVHGSQQQNLSFSYCSPTCHKLTSQAPERCCATAVHFTSFTTSAIWCFSDGCKASRGGKEKHINTVSLMATTARKGLSRGFCRYYGISAGIATLALAYGSVPMYKMVWQSQIVIIDSFRLTSTV